MSYCRFTSVAQTSTGRKIFADYKLELFFPDAISVMQSIV